MILGKGHGSGCFLSPGGGSGSGEGGLQADQPSSWSQGPQSSSQRPWCLGHDEGVRVQSWGLEKSWLPLSSLREEEFTCWKGAEPGRVSRSFTQHPYPGGPCVWGGW